MPYLQEKLVEESKEFQESGELEELGDILEVLDRVLKLVDEEKVKELGEKKAAERGRFSDNIVLEDIK